MTKAPKTCTIDQATAAASQQQLSVSDEPPLKPAREDLNAELKTTPNDFLEPALSPPRLSNRTSVIVACFLLSVILAVLRFVERYDDTVNTQYEEVLRDTTLNSTAAALKNSLNRIGIVWTAWWLD